MRTRLAAVGFSFTLIACAEGSGAIVTPIVNGARGGDASVVAVVHTRESGTRQLCTGTVVAPRVVLTAKHCVFEDLGGTAWTAIPPSRLSIVLGDDIVGAPGDAIDVLSIATTDGPYRDGDGANGGDLALLSLASDVGLPPLEIAASAPTAGQAIRIVGFGYTEAGAGGLLGTRHEGSASIVAVASGTFTSEGAQWTCTGDSGGPAIDTSGRVLGVTSIGPRNCLVSSSIYTRIDQHLDLLASVGVGASEADAASGLPDASAATDSGLTSGADAGAASGGGCSAAAGRSSPPALVALLVAFLAVVARARTSLGAPPSRAPACRRAG
jgi:secreted trypsin-like serine protease